MSSSVISPFAAIRSSCAALLIDAKYVEIDEEALAKFAADLDTKQITSAEAAGFPLRFDSNLAEINFLGMINLLNFGSGFREELHKELDRGAYETILYGCMGMHLSGDMSAAHMLRLNKVDVAALFQLPRDEEYEIQRGIRSTRPHKLRALSDAIHTVMNNAGRVLRELQFDSLGHFIMGETKVMEVKEKAQAPTATALVNRLVRFFPFAYDDKYHIPNGEPAFDALILKKAQLLVSTLFTRFKDEEPKLAFTDIDDLTIFADNVVPAVLRHFGVLKANETLSALIDGGTTVRNARQLAELRASAIVACDRIVAKANEDSQEAITCRGLDMYIWGTLAKQTDIRALRRHKDTHTVFY